MAPILEALLKTVLVNVLVNVSSKPYSGTGASKTALRNGEGKRKLLEASS